MSRIAKTKYEISRIKYLIEIYIGQGVSMGLFRGV